MAFPQEILSELVSYLKTIEKKGVKSIYMDEAARIEAEKQHPLSGSEGEEDHDKVGYAGEGEAVADLLELEEKVRNCVDCPLHETRRNTVFGTGDFRTKVMFIGEAPGRDEDLKGEPFVGRAGQLLDKIFQAIDLRREEVFITNILKCRPPENRDPAESEVRSCEKYLIAQIEIIRPQLICALGRIAAQWLLRNKAPLSALRLGEHTYQNTPVLVTYHPAALLRQPRLKRTAWEDFKKLKSMLESG